MDSRYHEQNRNRLRLKLKASTRKTADDTERLKADKRRNLITLVMELVASCLMKVFCVHNLIESKKKEKNFPPQIVEKSSDKKFELPTSDNTDAAKK
jgi:hypothetical protein